MTVLDTVYAALPDATEMPSGRYRGKTDVPMPDYLRWDGKVFEGDRVWNLLGPIRAVEGRVSLANGFVLIDYRIGALRLRDFLKPCRETDPDGWLGYFDLRGTRVYFALVKE